MRLPAQSTRVGQVSYRRGTPGQPGLPPTLLGVRELHSRAGIQNVYNLSTTFVQAGSKSLRLLDAQATYSTPLALNRRGRRGAKPRTDTCR